MDKSAHKIMEIFKECYKTLTEGEESNVARVGNYIALYHEEGLYSVYNGDICFLVYADSPYKAIERVMANVVIHQNGKTNYNIQHCDTLIV